MATILALETDLFFAVKVRDTLKRAGYETHITRSMLEYEAQLRTDHPIVGLVDFAARGVDWLACIQSGQAMGVPVIVHGPHVDLEAQAEARAAGATRVIANSRLAELPALIERILARAGAEGPLAGDSSEESQR